MPQLRDVPTVIRRVGFFSFIKRVTNQVLEDNLLTFGAAMAYSWLLAVFPFLIFVLTILPYLPNKTKIHAQEDLHTFLYNNLPITAADTLWNNLGSVLLEAHRGGLVSASIVLTLYFASNGVVMTLSSLDRCYELVTGRPFLKQRLVAALITISIAILVILVLLLLPIGTLVTKFVVNHTPVAAHLVIALNVARYTIALILMIAILAIVYHFGPAVRQRFHVITPGAVFTIVVWLGLGILFRIYVDKIANASYRKTYGTVGGVAILLFFFYLDAVVLLIGAELNSEIDFEILNVPRGSRDLLVRGAAGETAEF